MDVVDGDQARIAEAAGAVAVMALERIPADIKADGGVARSSDPSMIIDVMNSCSVPVMAKARIGHFYEAKLLEALEGDRIAEGAAMIRLKGNAGTGNVMNAVRHARAVYSE